VTVTALPIAERVRRWRGAIPRGATPLGVSACAPGVDALTDGDAIVFAPTCEYDDPAALSAALPEPIAGALIVVCESGDSSLFGRLLGRRLRVARAVRGAALLLRGYRHIGGGVDPVSGLDLCWGEA